MTEKEKTAPVVSVGADTEQSILSKNTIFRSGIACCYHSCRSSVISLDNKPITLPV